MSDVSTYKSKNIRWSCIPIPILYGIVGIYTVIQSIVTNRPVLIEGMGMILVSMTSIMHHYYADNNTLKEVDSFSNYILFTFFCFCQPHWFYLFGAPITTLGYLLSCKSGSDLCHVSLVHLPTLVMFMMIAFGL